MRSLTESITVFLILAGPLPLGLLIGPVSAAGPPPNADWVVIQNEELSDQTIWMDWNLTVKSGARLELRNVSLNFNFTATKIGGIMVEAGASLLMAGCKLNALVSTNNLSYFVVNGSLELLDSETYEIGPFGGRSGVQLLGGNNVIRGSKFNNHHNIDTIYCNRSRLDIQNCTFQNSNKREIVAGESILEVVNCTFVYPSIGILANYSSVNITGSDFFPGNQGCMLYSCSARIQDCDFGSPRSAPIPAGGPAGSPAPDLLIQDCVFDSVNQGFELIRSSSVSSSYCGIAISDPRQTVISNCSFRSLNYGIRAARTDSVLVHSSRFATSAPRQP